MFVGNWPSMRALSSPDHQALYDFKVGESSTFSSYSSACIRLSRMFFRELRIGKGDRVALLSPSRKEYLEIFFAAARIGAVFVPLSETMPKAQLLAIVKDVRPAVLFYDRSCREMALALQSTGFLPGIIDIDEIKAEKETGVRKKEIPVEEVELFLEDPLLLIYDNVSEGHSGVILSHGAVMWNAMSVSLMYGLNERDRAPLFFPMSSPIGLTLFTLPLFLSGGTTLIGESTTGSAIKYKEAESISFIYIENGNDWEDTLSSLERLPSLRFCAHLDCMESSEIFNDTVNRCPARLIPLYCLLEAGPHNFFASPELCRKNRNTVGQPLPHVEMTIMDPEGRAVPSGETGELMIRGHHMFSGYWNNPSGTRAAFYQGWLRTGDLARCDEGSYFILRRKSRGARLPVAKKAAP